jgi:hypothetical protein
MHGFRLKIERRLDGVHLEGKLGIAIWQEPTAPDRLIIPFPPAVC